MPWVKIAMESCEIGLLQYVLIWHGSLNILFAYIKVFLQTLHIKFSCNLAFLHSQKALAFCHMAFYKWWLLIIWLFIHLAVFLSGNFSNGYLTSGVLSYGEFETGDISEQPNILEDWKLKLKMTASFLRVDEDHWLSVWLKLNRALTTEQLKLSKLFTILLACKSETTCPNFKRNQVFFCLHTKIF